MRGAIAECGVAAVEVEIGVEVISYFQSGYFQAGKRAAARQQLGFERILASFGLRVVTQVARPGVTGLGLRVGNALATGLAGILAALVRVNNQAGRRLLQRQGLLRGGEHQFSGHLRRQVPAHDPPRVGIAPGGQVAPAPTY